MNIDAGKIAQEEYCEEHSLPLFAPTDGICHRCYKNIYKRYERNEKWTTGYTAKEARNIHITSCPHCNASFLE